jgi:hypothetical protein
VRDKIVGAHSSQVRFVFIAGAFDGERRPSRDMRSRVQTLRCKNLQHREAFCRSK